MFHFQSYIGITAKTAFCIALLSGCFGCSADADDEAQPSIPEAQPDWTVLRDEVKSMRAELARQGAYAFVTNTATTPRTAPHIHSQCWVDWLPKEEVERRAYEQEKRDFGLDFLGELEKIALESCPLDDIDGAERRAERCLAIAEWLKTSKGYGNYPLKRWCERMAATSIGVMAVSSDCALPRVEALVARIDALDANLRHQLAALNEEAPHKYTMPKTDDMDAAMGNLERQWAVHLREAMKYFKANRGNSLPYFADVRNEDKKYSFYMEENLPPVRDGLPARGTMRRFWVPKCHNAFLVCGLYDNARDRIKDLVLFRKLAGDIPRPPKNMTSADDGFVAVDYRDQFRERWKPYEGKYGKNYAGTAASQIFFGQFVDHFTLQQMLTAGDLEELKNQKKR